VKDFTKQDTKAGLILIAMWEFFGTALFTYGIVASGGWGPYVSCSLFISILILSNWTGGHVNPAVSLGFLVNGNITVPEFLAYIIGQGSGALVGAIAAAALLDIISCPWVPLE
jgi:glycerol uptake facilitator-like aquaporin